MTKQERMSLFCSFAESADAFESAIKTYEEKGLCYMLASVNAAYDKSGGLGLLSVPALQSSFNNFYNAFKAFSGGVAASLAIADLLGSEAMAGGKDGGTASQVQFTSVFSYPEESALSVFDAASQGGSVCLCTCLVDQPSPLSRAYMALFACMPDI